MNEDTSSMMSFEKRVKIVTETANFVNRIKELNSKCDREMIIRERRQIDGALLTAADFGLKQFQKNILNVKLNELESLRIENMNLESKGEYCFLTRK